MGWNSWGYFGCRVSEALVRQTADALADSGLRDVGYRYVVVDDCWQGARSPDGTLQADPARFPSGVQTLAEYVHARGLKFGLYTDVGERTCQGRPGSLGHEMQDAATFARWGVDFLKVDWCHSQGVDASMAYRRMSNAIAATGRPIVFSICEWGLSRPASWGRGVGNLWRTSGDLGRAFDRPPIYPSGQAVGVISPVPIEMDLGVLQALDRQSGLARFAGPGGWNDPDLLHVGNDGMTPDEQRAQLALWAILAAPLVAGTDVRAMAPEALAILMDREVIAIDQDPAGWAGDRAARIGDIDIWARPLAAGGVAVALLNRGAGPLAITVDAPMLKLKGRYCLRDITDHIDRGFLSVRFTARVPPHAVRLLKLTPSVVNCPGVSSGAAFPS
jgi:alpha-galactosidase